jgi:hypothetical protein
MGDTRSQRDFAVDVDAAQTWHPMQRDHVPGTHTAPLDLHEEIGSPGEKAPIGPEASGEGHRIGEARRLVILKAAQETNSSALAWAGQMDARRSAASLTRSGGRAGTPSWIKNRGSPYTDDGASCQDTRRRAA